MFVFFQDTSAQDDPIFNKDTRLLCVTYLLTV